MAAVATRSVLTKNINGDTSSKDKSIKPETPSKPVAKSSDTNNADVKPSTDSAGPLAPPPKPGQSNSEDGDYFSGNHQGNGQSYNSEQNLFESAFAKLPETPGGTQLPPVASLTSPAGQLTGPTTGGFNWGNGSLRSGPLSPAMLSGPAGEDYFSTNASLRGGFPTPNESSLRTGLTPGGGGSMFPPAPSPNTQALFNQLGAGFSTPGALDFHRTAMNANKKSDPFTSSAAPPAATSTAADSNAQTSTSQQNFDQHDAANGLFMLAQAGTESQGGFGQVQHDGSKRPARTNNGSISNVSEITQGRDSAPSEETEQKPNTRNKGKKAAAKNSRKSEEVATKQPAKKKSKANNGGAQVQDHFDEMEDSEDEGIKDEEDNELGDHKDTRKMTDEEKRKNFLERNRVAALKCRQRKKQWLANLQAKVEIFSSENDALSAQVTQLREEILNLKTILIAHKDCPIAQQQAAVGQYIPAHGSDYGAPGNPYGNFQPHGQQVPMGAGGPRRYS